MTLGPILRAKLAKYIQDYELSDIKEDDAYVIIKVIASGDTSNTKFCKFILV